MKLVVFNGSPRGTNSGTKILLEKFTEAYIKTNGNFYETHYIKEKIKNPEECRSIFKNTECVLLAFPLYTDCMPGIVKAFIEHLEPLCKNKNNPKIAFLVQSGFIEASHSRFVEIYLEKLAKLLNSQYLGTIVKGGVEGIGKRPEIFDKKTTNGIYEIGKYFGENYKFDENMLKNYAKPEKLSFMRRGIFRILTKILLQPYWNSLMKKNGALKECFDKPYLDD